MAARLTTLKHGGDRRSDQAANLPVVSQGDAAKLMNVSERSVRSASALLVNGIPEVISAVERGEIAVSAAVHFVDLPKQQQIARIKAADSARDAVKAIKAAVQKKHNRSKAEAAMHRDKPVVSAETTQPDVSKEVAIAHKDGPSDDFEILIGYFGKLRSENPSSQLMAGRLLPSDRAAKLRDISGPLRDCEFAVKLLPHLVRILKRAKAKRAEDGAAAGAAGEPTQKTDRGVLGGSSKVDGLGRRDDSENNPQARQRKARRREAKLDRRRRGGGPTVVTLQSHAVQLFFNDRYGGVFPDDDAGRDDLSVALELRASRGEGEPALRRYVASSAPWMTEEETSQLLDRVYANPVKFRADTLGLRIGLSDADRTRLGITTIGGFDFPRAARLARRQAKKNARRTAKRRAKGVRPREQYLLEALSRTRPWEAFGICKSTWRRRGKPSPRNLTLVRPPAI